MTGRHAPPPPTLADRLFAPTAVACGVLAVAGAVFGVGTAVAPRVAAESVAAVPTVGEAVGSGGPLVLPSIGVVVASETSTAQSVSGQSVSVSPRRPVRPREPLVTMPRVTRTPDNTPQAVLSQSVATETLSPTTVLPPSATEQAATSTTPPVTTTSDTTSPAGADTSACQQVTAPEQCAEQTVGPGGEPSPSPAGETSQIPVVTP